MSTRIESENGEELWGPDIFGKYSIDKIKVIAEILKGVFKDNPITFINQSKADDEVYTKTESNTLFILKSDFNSIAGDLVKSLTSSYLKELANTQGVASVTEVRLLEKVSNYLTRACFGQTYTEIKDLASMNIAPLPDRVQQVETQMVSIDTRINHTMNVVFETNRDGSFSSISKVATKEDLKSVNDKVGSGNITVRNSKNVIDAVNRLDKSIVALESISEFVNTLSTTVNTLSSTVNNLSATVSRLSSTVDRVDRLVGNDALKTTSKTITGAINELKV
jgi:hypothetical protein|nr:MAG TPA: hypothetical protein [Bacteriophage sp.]DAW66403.1 MAG TPA: hypothetical protein [Bacteriophage sp.]